MLRKNKITIIILILLSTISISYARFTKTISKTGTITTTEIGYCQSKGISSFRDCLIRNDSQQELTEALSTIDKRTKSVTFNEVEPINSYTPKTTYRDYTNKTNTSAIISTTAARFTYVVESKLIKEFKLEDTDITKIAFNTETGFYTYKDSKTGSINDIVTTQTDMENGIYKYTCLNTTSNGNCSSLFLFTEAPYLISESNRFKQGYVYSYNVSGTSKSSAGLYKGEDDYTKDNENYTYYYRGEVNNNWVKFGDFLWRIVRINGNGSIRLIYSGLASNKNHTGNNALIKNSKNSTTTTFGDVTSHKMLTTDIKSSTSEMITTTYSNGIHGNTYVGYMYNTEKTISKYPDKTPADTTTKRLNYFPTFSNIANTRNYYFFKDFDPTVDCVAGNNNDESGACTLKCKTLGEEDGEGVDCVKSIWNNLATKEGNYSTSKPGVYPKTNPTQYLYTGNYKYTCWGYGTPVVKENEDKTTSVYVTCPIVYEIVGTVKNQPTHAKVVYHGLFSTDENTANKNIKDSNIKSEVDYWYSKNILTKNEGNKENLHNLEDYLSDEIFCNDRSSNSTNFPLQNGSSYVYNPYTRNTQTNKNPSFKCQNLDNDGFTLKDNNKITQNDKGNKKLTYPVGLITVDEASFAGGKNSSMNHKYYLNIGQNYWTMSPSSFSSYHARASIWFVSATGNLTSNSSATSLGIRPVINLSKDVLYAGGIGTEEEPYTIKLSN